MLAPALLDGRRVKQGTSMLSYRSHPWQSGQPGE
jgi:hypothetical protein